MATLEQLENGLRKAHAAGNADHARAFAAEIRKMRMSPKADFSNVQTGSSTVKVKPRPATYGPGRMPGVATEIGGMLDGLQHHLLNIPVALG